LYGRATVKCEGNPSGGIELLGIGTSKTAVNEIWLFERSLTGGGDSEGRKRKKREILGVIARGRR